MELKSAIKFIRSLPKTLYFNLRYFPLKDALKLPVFIDYKVRLMKCGGQVKLGFKPSFFAVRIGAHDLVIIDKRYNRTMWKVDGLVVFNGRMKLGHSSGISVDKGAELIFGDNINISVNVKIICVKKIVFGDNVRVSWNSQFMDTDFHALTGENGEKTEPHKEIMIGSYIWIGNNCSVKKGVKIEDRNIVASNSVVVRDILGEKQIYGGIPAKLIRTGYHRTEF